MKSGIRVRVQRDGLFLFDFETWPLAPITIVPGYIRPKNPYIPPSAHTSAAAAVQDRAALRAQVMNVHQACITTAEHLVARRAAAMGFPVTSWNTFKTFDINSSPTYQDDTEDIRALAHNVLNRVYPSQVQLHRRTIELPVVQRSLDLLDEILLRNDRAIIELVDAAYMAACRAVEHRLGECIAVGWTACEQLITLAWKRLLSGIHQERPTGEGIAKSRREKLLGRDYTASVMVEMLELQGVLPHKLYVALEAVRKARNGWAHEMRLPTSSDIRNCQVALQDTLRLVEGIPLQLQFGFRGTGAPWPLHMWEEFKRKRGR